VTVAVLGTGIMGGAMARNSARAGIEVRAWSLPLRDAEVLATDGVTPCPTAATAATGADLVVTMAPDARAIQSFAEGDEGFLPVMAADAIWIQSSTVGVEPAERLHALANRYGVRFVDAPVLGSKGPAERAELLVMASGEEQAIDRCRPYFDAIARKVLRLPPGEQGSRLKMVTNAWITSSIAAVADAIALADALDVDGSAFLEAIEGTAMDMGYAHEKGEMMLARSYPAHGHLRSGIKDASLALEAARSAGLPAPVIAAAVDVMTSAGEMGHGDDDMAAAFEATRRRAQPRRDARTATTVGDG
jgi:3-hydroxyisobutyrate dehydrogenase